MDTGDIDVLDHTVQITHAMIDELDRHLRWDDKPRSYRLLTAVLHAVLEWSSVKSIGGPAATFPLRLCGASLGQWQASTTDFRARDTTDFVARVNPWFKPDPLEHPLAAIRTVLDLLFDRVGKEEAEKIGAVLPVELRQAQYSAGRWLAPSSLLHWTLQSPPRSEVGRVQA